LDYQKLIFKQNKEFDSVDFTTLVEHRVCKAIEWMSIYRTEERLDRIMQWVKENKKIVIDKNQNEIIDSLKWIGEPKILKNLSKELKIKGFTKKPTDFEKVFTEQKIINWLKEPEYLAYLLFSLYNSKIIKAYKRGYFKTAEIYFYDCTDTVVKKFKEGQLKELNHNITKRKPAEYLKLKANIDSFLKGIIK
jgi:hypothetical protein